MSRDEIRAEKFRQQLIRCGIEVFPLPAKDRHNRYQWYGSIGGKIRITDSHNYYMIAEGRVPLHIAESLYADPVGKTDIRVCGHCGCPAPVDPWIAYYHHSGAKIVGLDTKREWESWLGKETILAEIAEKALKEHVFCDDLRGKADVVCVELYHIDSELGLYKFAEALR